MEPKVQHVLEHDLAGRKFSLQIGPMQTQAHGYVTVSLGDTVLLANTSQSDRPREGMDYFPLMCDYEERYYAAGKIKGSKFIKREGRPSENAVMTSRLIDRPIRPLFPKGMKNDVQVIVTVLSADMEVDPGATAITAASTALMLSGMPFEGPVAAVRIGYVAAEEGGKEELVVNPTYEQCEKGRLNLVVAGTENAITMVEAAASEVTEDIILQAFEIAHKHIKELCAMQKELAAKVNPKKLEYAVKEENTAAVEAFNSFINEEKLRSIGGKSKKAFKESLHATEDEMYEKFAAEIEEEKFSKGELSDLLVKARENMMRDDILEKDERIDGRKPDEIRTLQGKVGVVPRPHGSAIFQRGETQALTLTTLGAPGDAQIIDTMDRDEKRFYMHHYNFPPYSVGDVKPMRGASRRDIGHGDLGERALLPVLPAKADFPYAIWLVSEILSCNGSSSMASVCGSSLSLMHAGVPIKGHVAGIAMGLMTSKDFDGKNGKYKILTDIQGLEDFGGDMDFKVTGTREGITALQMDIKLKGVSMELLTEALERGKKARFEILDFLTSVIPEPNRQMSPYAPLIITHKIDTDFIGAVIGKGGETIQEITKECDVDIDIEEDGTILITAPDQEKGERALDWIKKITYVPNVGDIFEGKVVKIMDFGAFVEFSPGKDGLVHISQLSKDRVNKVEDVVKMGDPLKVKLMEIDSQGRYNLSHKATL